VKIFLSWFRVEFSFFFNICSWYIRAQMIILLSAFFHHFYACFLLFWVKGVMGTVPPNHYLLHPLFIFIYRLVRTRTPSLSFHFLVTFLIFLALQQCMFSVKSLIIVPIPFLPYHSNKFPSPSPSLYPFITNLYALSIIFFTFLLTGTISLFFSNTGTKYTMYLILLHFIFFHVSL